MNTINHIGLTLAAAMPAEFIIRQSIASSSRREHARASALASVPLNLANRLNAGVHFDFRLVIIGSILPDILDKPLGFYLAPELVNNNLRTIGHGGLFALAFILIGLAIHFALRNPQVLVMAVSSAGHLAMDKMWLQKETLLWPFFGFQFPQGTTTIPEYVWFHIRALMQPQALDYVTGAIVLAFLIYVIFSSGLPLFIRSGKVLPVRSR